MNDASAMIDESGFSPFRYRGWSFLCGAARDEDGLFWSITICELVSPSGMPFLLVKPTQPRHGEASARVQAQVQAMKWVDERTAAPHLLVRQSPQPADATTPRPPRTIPKTR